MPPNWSFVERERAKRVLSDRDAQQRRGGIIILLSATMWHHIRADEGVSAASAAQSAPRPCSVHNRGRRSHIHPERKTPAAATVDPDQVRRSLKGSKLPPEPLTSEREPAVGAARVFVWRARSAVRTPPGGETGLWWRRSHAAADFQTRSGESKRRREQKSRGGFGVEHPPRLRRTLALADVSTSLSCSFTSVGHMGAPICPSASPKASRHLTEARNKVAEVLLPYNWTPRGSGHSLQNRFPERRRSVCVRAGVPACLRASPRACVLFRGFLLYYINHVSYPTSAVNFDSITAD